MTHNEKVLALLSDKQPHSHHEIYALHVVGHSRIASLRAKGYGIEQWRDGDLYMYELVSVPVEAPVAGASTGTAATAGADGTGLRTAAEQVPDYQLVLV